VGHAVAAARPSPARVLARLPLLPALVSGALLALSFPRYGHPAFAWIALTPLLVAIGQRAPQITVSRAWWLGLATGAVYFAGTVYWTSGVMAQYGGFSMALAAAIAGLLVAFLALFPAAFAAVLALLVTRLDRRALLLAPAVWVATELGRTLLFGGFPWALVGYAQTSVLPVAQLASLVGVYGLSALIVLVSAVLAYAALEPGRDAWIAAGTTGLLLAAVVAWGSARLADSRLTRAGAPLSVGLIQGNVPQDQKWDPAYEDEILFRYLRFTREAADRGVTAVLWPESATPFYFEESPRGEAIRLLARERGLWLLLGSDELSRHDRRISFNSAFMVRPDGTTAAVYRKVRLVPFGEYVPFRRLLFFAAPLVESIGDFAPGEAPVTLPLDGHAVSTAICYEVVYPALIREGVLRGSSLLTTITNDAWFGRSSAPYQHFEMAAMRAIEQGRYLARAANTGISGIVDPYGRVIVASGLFVEQVLVGEVRLIDERTVYARIGNVVAWASAVVTVLAIGTAWRAGHRRNARDPRTRRV
jgi:apolipoprotein N-acyltransferase